ncbi:SGNH/GDSL hydrolase family protein [Nocardioides jiangxiensis]|uniref:SGNH/GDSL hydrolase family protein n=1 Tax=Nocardioides jiangxiensis TaxID=3064524 RepID=A0ABT9B0W6_9ACTN|nr:SGNH/GDSL hydrolase family protein [Nocardioides sp. WY-20]MDO7867272.1 SGNH/GDSL hydrolase family protein [Nocardioides sp. WY-20]
MRVLLCGDSQLARLARYPLPVARHVVNRAVGGATALEVAQQVADLDPREFDVVMLGVGTNDAGTRPVPLSDFTAAVRSLVDWARPTPVVFVSSPGADPRADAAYDDANMAAYAAAARDVVTAAGGRFVDTPRLLGPLGRVGRMPDGIHVGKLAHAVYIPALRRAARRALA